MITDLKIKKGVYLVIDPAMDMHKRNVQLTKIRDAELSAIQIWDNFTSLSSHQINDVFQSVFDIFKEKEIPIFINNQWQYLMEYPFSGIHFDLFPNDLEGISEKVGRSFLKGLTLNNDLSMVSKAKENQFDYLSFCSLFPSSTSNSCEVVHFDTVKKCREITDIPIFLAGGITPQNMALMEELDYYGVAVVSGIMEAENPLAQLEKYMTKVKS